MWLIAHAYLQLLLSLPDDTFKTLNQSKCLSPCFDAALKDKWVNAHAPVVEFLKNFRGQVSWPIAWCALIAALANTPVTVKELHLPELEYKVMSQIDGTRFVLQSTCAMVHDTKSLTTLSLQSLELNSENISAFEKSVQNIPETVTNMHLKCMGFSEESSKSTEGIAPVFTEEQHTFDTLATQKRVFKSLACAKSLKRLHLDEDHFHECHSAVVRGSAEVAVLADSSECTGKESMCRMLPRSEVC